MRLLPAGGVALERILAESHSIWSDGLTLDAYTKFNAAQMRTPWGGRHLRRVVLADDDGEAVTSAKRYELTVRLDGERLAAVGIGAVFTPERHRGRGYAREIIDRITDEAAQDGAAIALLFSEIDPDYYARLGFTAVSRRDLLIRPRTGRRPGAPAVLVRAGEERDIPAITALARSMAERHRLALEPSEDFIRFGLSKKRLLAGLLDPGLLTVEFFIVEEGAGAVAFAILTITSEDVVLEMCGDRDPSGARVGALLQVLAARDPATAGLPISCFLPPGWLPQQLEIEGGAPVRAVMMLKGLRAGVLDRPVSADDILYWHGDLF
jgi:GNAT superfamily N-acetyltransferase